jgi:hypothetical protein
MFALMTYTDVNRMRGRPCWSHVHREFSYAAIPRTAFNSCGEDRTGRGLNAHIPETGPQRAVAVDASQLSSGGSPVTYLLIAAKGTGFGFAGWSLSVPLFLRKH